MSSQTSNIDPQQFVANLFKWQYREVTMVLATLVVVANSLIFFPGFDNLHRGLQADISLELLAVLVIVAVTAGVVKGMIGFGYALITTPIFASVVDPSLAVVVLAIPPWMLNLFQIGETNTGLEFVRKEWVLLLMAVTGSVIGVTFLAEFSTGPVVPFFIGLVIFGYAGFQVTQGFITVEATRNPIALSGVGFLQGFILAVANFGPLLPAYFHTFERDTKEYIGALAMVVGTIFTVRLVQMTLFTDLLTPYRLWLGSVIAVVTIAGLLLGTYLRRIQVDEEKFNWFVVALLLVISINIFRNTIPALFL